MSRATQLNRRFNEVLSSKVAVDGPKNAKLFIEAICHQEDPVACVQKIVASSVGPSSVQNAVRFDLSPKFLNSDAIPLIEYLLRVGDVGDMLLDHLLVEIVDPPIFWNAFIQAFERGELAPRGEVIFAQLLLRLMSLSSGNTARFREVAKRQTIQDRLHQSPEYDVKDIAYRIKHILSAYLSDAPISLDGPGGRHDNDFVDFRAISILPTIDEIDSKRDPFIRHASELEDPEAEGTRLADYLDNTFRLLREDMIYELRDEIQIILKKKKGRRRGLIIDSVTLDGIYTGEKDKTTRWGIKLKCKDDLESLKKVPDKQRRLFLEKDPSGSKILKHQSLVCVANKESIVCFATVYRVEELLAQKPPIIVLQLEGEATTAKVLHQFHESEHTRLIQIDTAIFGFGPVLKAIQKMQVVPLSEELLFWKPCCPVGMADVIATPVAQSLAQNPSHDLQTLLMTPTSIVLDKSQAASLLSGLTQKLSLIQGPPGTGKSFIGALLAKAIHNFTKHKILVVCYTNHALDQFIEDLWKIGIPEGDMVRLGGRSNTQVAHLKLNNQSRGFKRSKADWAIIDNMKTTAKHLGERLEQSFSRFNALNISQKDILTHIEFQDPDYFDAFEVPDNDDDMIRVGKSGQAMGPTYLIDRWHRGHDAGIFKGEPHVDNDIWSMESSLRKEKMKKWVSEIRKEMIEDICTIGNNYDSYQEQIDRKFGETVVETLKAKRIIACTTTGAAKYIEDLRAAKTDVLLVEEAGEILESHVLTALGEDTSQMILIGDHKQLRPKVNNYKLTVEKGDGYALNMSLFERLILKGYPHETLTSQHRMRPEISAIIRKITYPDLTDAPRTRDRKNIRGVRDNIIFVDHRHEEDKDDLHIADRADAGSSSSKQNTYEVGMVLKIVRYLAQQGYGTENMVVLTPYLGQLSKLRNAFKTENDPILNDIDSHELIRAGLLSPDATTTPKRPIRLATIDNYQGEESNIVICSLTRSNPSNQIGFMNSPERLNVLISRARDGLILIGNSETFMKSRTGKALWTQFIDLIKEGGHLFSGFPVHCERHPDKKEMLKKAEDFNHYCPDGGCMEPCGVMLSCNVHVCPSKCHRLDDHSEMPCQHKYQGMCEANQHRLSWKCHPGRPTTCSRCEKEAERALKDAEHAQRMAELESKLQEERDAFAAAQREKEQANAVAQKIKDLEAAKSRTLDVRAQSSLRAKDALSAPPTPAATTTAMPSSTESSHQSISHPLSTQPQQSSQVSEPSQTKGVAQKSDAYEEWQYQKRINGEQNEAIDGIMELTGLEEIKAQVLSIKAAIDLKKRQGVDLRKERLNLALLGNPGTGKSTVARLYAKFLQSIQVLPGNAYCETTGASLAHDGVGGAKKLVEDAVKAGGGTIFIDEAYQLVSENNSSGSHVLDFLLAEMENRVGNLIFIFAGYSKRMEKFFQHNPGLPSRIPYQLHFQDYTYDELLIMFESLVERKYNGKMKVEDGTKGLYSRIAIRRLSRGRDREGFGNARALENMFSRMCQRQALRINKERKDGLLPSDFDLIKEDIIGPDPSKVIPQSVSWKKLQELIGLDAVKESIRSLFILIEMNYYRELQEKEPLEITFNRVFLGSPGTGKTTVAKLYGQVLASLGLLSDAEVVVKNPSDFVGAYLGHSEKNTKAILDNTVGKVLVIDEAYMLYSKNSGYQDSFKTTVIDTIVAEVQSTPGEDRCVLLLGYKEQMVDMFQNVNPGLSRRFAIENAFVFEDFTTSQLKQILEFKLKAGELKATDTALKVAIDMLDRSKSRPNFGNAGEVENVLGIAKNRYQKRQSSIPPHERADVVLEPEDFDPDWNRSENSAANLAKLFEGIIGCEHIMQQLSTYQSVARVMKSMDMREQIPTNFIFKGPPGTGKTTVARKFGQVYYDMGFLSSPEVIECSASDMVGQYVGQTGPKTKKLFEKALGKVLFVDEAYRLGQGQFSQEAIDELVGLITQEAFMNKIVIILAGYDKDMNQLLAVNSGLSSRFPEEIIFHNMSTDHCLNLLDKDLKNKRINIPELTELSSAFNQEVRAIFDQMSSLSNWGNARDVKNIARKLTNKAFTTITNLSDNSPSISTQEVLNIMKSMLGEQQQRLNIPQASRRTPSQNMPPMASSSHAEPPPPPTQTSSSVKPHSSQPPPKSQTSKAQSAPSQRHRSKGRNPPNLSSTADARASHGPSAPSPNRGGFIKKSKGSPAAAQNAEIQRDAGVSDEIWQQLQADIANQRVVEKNAKDEVRKLNNAFENAAKTQRDVEARAEKLAKEQASDAAARESLLKERKAAQIQESKARAARERAVNALIERKREEERRRRQELNIQQKLRSMGVCPQGFMWIKQSHGYRCAGGAHFLTNARLGID